MYTWLLDANLGNAVAHLPWVSDGIQDGETSPLFHVRRLSGRDPSRALPSPAPIYGAIDTQKLYLDLLFYIASDMKQNPRAKRISCSTCLSPYMTRWLTGVLLHISCILPPEA